VRRVLIILAGVLILALALGLPASAATETGSAKAATLADCLTSKHVCVSSDARSLVSQGQQSQLEQQVGNDDIYLVVAPSGSSGYDPAMRQLVSTLGAKHGQFAVGFLDSRLKHFGAYNRGVVADGVAASVATDVVSQHRADGDIFAALQEFVQEIQQSAATPGTRPGPEGAPASQPSASGPPVGLIVLGVIILLAAGGYFFLLRPRNKRRRQEAEQQLKEAKLAAQDDLIALNGRITDHDNDVTIAGNSEAAAEQAAALDAYERGTHALDAARKPADMAAVSRAIAEGQYRLACAEAVAHGQPKPGRRPMCFFDPRHGMSVADLSWAPPDGGPSRTVPACIDCQRLIERGDQPAMRTVQDGSGNQIQYVNAGFAPSYWGGFGLGGGMFTGFLLGQALGGPGLFGYGDSPGDVNNYYYGDSGTGGDSFGGGDFGGSDSGGGDFGGDDNFGGGDFGGSDFGGGDDNFGGGDF
jgi:type II secretory pathway pseudopilin PulG